MEHFEIFYESSRDKVFRAVALTIGSSDLADEAVDEAMARAFSHWNKVSRGSNPSGWVYKTAVNWANSFFRKKSLERKFKCNSSRGNIAISATLLNVGLRDALERLPLNLRSVIVTRYFLDLSLEETAIALDLKVGTVKSRSNKALGLLQATLGEDVSATPFNSEVRR